ncbi:acyl-CoA--6-aminopenicillanic acid acyl-transferase [Salipaludibacillus keqinensis]|uniref:Acyl-CoA--6-aminopenicillanic acid acyl-transferase n=1 Tax=Salipaludibacillus keqinensis TaxID=2045207 RepID=A0A323TJH6_9BACI|nr:C45 family peptidase [Salipaludibacillus keqinensis]PYZ95121.1 acyl-CoA--6-aminopenicillanic acid acyl-transferase [Salipaludibacillus keqinensis]
MMKIEVNVLQGRGNAYTFGVNQAKALKDTPLFQKHLNRRKKSIRKYTSDYQVAKQFMHTYSPSLIEEVQGIADELGWSVQDVMHEYGGYQQSWKKSGCSAIMKDGVYGRNYDYHPKTYDGRFVLWQPNHGFAHIGFAQRMIGRMDGMNEKGLALGYHFVNRLRPEDGFICTSIARFVLDSCENVSQAVERLKDIPHRHAFNYSLADRSGNSMVVEASSKGVNVMDEHLGACTNHFQTLTKLNENRYKIEESQSRLVKLQRFQKGKPSAENIFQFLNDRKYGICKLDYRNWSGTIHTAVYDTKNLEVNVGIGVDALKVRFSFEDWLKGKKTVIRKIRGVLPEIEGTDHLEIPEQVESNGFINI